MLNFTVDALDGFGKRLEEKGVAVVREINTYEFCKFARISDPHGNIIGLWEPLDEKHTQMVKKGA